LKEILHFEDIAWRIILERILKNRIGECGLISFGSRQGPVTGFCEASNEPVGFIKCLEFLY
jgi:hypothetical protein